MRLALLTLPPTFVLSACAAPDSSGCGADPLMSYVGQPAVEVAAIDTGGPARVVRSGQPVNGDLNPRRLNIVTDNSGRVVRLTCG